MCFSCVFCQGVCTLPEGQEKAKAGFKEGASVVCCYIQVTPNLAACNNKHLLSTQFPRVRNLGHIWPKCLRLWLRLEGPLPRWVPHMVASRRPDGRLPPELVIGPDDCLNVAEVTGEKSRGYHCGLSVLSVVSLVSGTSNEGTSGCDGRLWGGCRKGRWCDDAFR